MQPGYLIAAVINLTLVPLRERRLEVLYSGPASGISLFACRHQGAFARKAKYF